MGISKLRPLVLTVAAFTYSLCVFQVALADDTEIYVPKDLPADQQVRPNILFVLDSSGSMDTTVSGTNKSRNKVMHEVVNGLIDSLKSGTDVNIGFMRYGGRSPHNTKRDNYDNQHGGHVIYPITHLKNDEIANEMKEVVKTVNTSDWTPLLETYYEAYLYFTGQERKFSGNRNNSSAMSGNKFVSPISHSCQKNHIIYITDGEPTKDIDANNLINNLIRNKDYASRCEVGTDGACLSQLAAYMANEDMALQGGKTSKPFDDPTNRKQTVTSHFVGFALDKEFLLDAANAGGGQYFTSDNASGLTEALQSIVVDITAENSTFVSPSVAVSAYNNLGFRNELYYALFRPSEGTNWPGNIKKYKLRTSKTSSGELESSIVDKNNNAAIDDDTGFFKDSASSFWNAVIDGPDVAKGGAAEKLKGRSDRKIYTWHSADRKAGAVTDTSVALEVFVNDTSKITNAMLGVTGSSNTRTEVVNWITKNTGRMGDVLHSEPRLVAYKTDEDLVRAQTAGSKEDLVMFVGSNEGFIHAIDPKNGNELYSFIPKELLHIPSKYLADNKGYSNKAYGIDGLLSIWSEYGALDTDNTKTAKKVNLYAGMRRGGSNYYALNVTDKNTPKLKWVIKGAYDPNIKSADKTKDSIRLAADVTIGFEKLGYTFSAPKLADINIAGKKTKVLIFSGGYDKKHDDQKDPDLATNDSIGNALYIVDAETGKLLWRASGNDDTSADLKLSTMTNSMPASPTLVDKNGNGLTDVIYVSDLRGQVFRFDIDQTAATLKNAIKGTRLAALGGTAAASNRRFFNSPDVALIRDSGQKPYFTVSIGSGFRESPLTQQTDDRFYMIRDKYVDGPRPASAQLITESTLTDVSATAAGGDTATIYAEIDALEAKIKKLNAGVVTAQQSYEQYKASTGYTAAYDEYLALYNQANQLQKEIDTLTNNPYGAFDPAQWDNGKPSNNKYLDQHVVEAQAQSGLQSAIVAAQKAFNALNTHGAEYNETDNPQAAKLARVYATMIRIQGLADQQARDLVNQENFLMKGNLEPAWTTELTAQTRDLFPSVAFDEEFGDFSDYDSAFTDQIAANRLAFEASNDYKHRSEFKGLTDLLVALSDPSADTSDLLSQLDAALTALPVDSISGITDIDGLLAQDQLTKEKALSDNVVNYKASADQIAERTVQLGGVQGQLALALKKADDIADDNDFDDKQEAIDNAYAAASHPTKGISALRTAINDKYAALDVTEGSLSSAQELSLKTSDGFYLRLVRGEKVLADSVSFRGSVLFSTFSPRGKTISMCGSDVGTGKVYALNLRDSKGMFTTEIGGVEYPVRSMELKRSGIPPAPAIIVTGDGPVALVGTQILDLESGLPVTPTHWREK